VNASTSSAVLMVGVRDPGDGTAATPEPAVTVLDGPSPGARLLRPTDALDDAAGRALQRVAADVIACAPALIMVDLSAVGTVTADGVAALVVVAETAGEADIGLEVVAGDRMRATLGENDVHDLFELYETVDEALEAM
jgi:anti-sigma B factor antagonist